MILRREPDGSFAGSTVRKDCAGDLHGATHTTSEVVITADGFASWDRGFDSDDRQVWGATRGGHMFRRVEWRTPEPRETLGR